MCLFVCVFVCLVSVFFCCTLCVSVRGVPDMYRLLLFQDIVCSSGTDETLFKVRGADSLKNLSRRQSSMCVCLVVCFSLLHVVCLG